MWLNSGLLHIKLWILCELGVGTQMKWSSPTACRAVIVTDTPLLCPRDKQCHLPQAMPAWQSQPRLTQRGQRSSKQFSAGDKVCVWVYSESQCSLQGIQWDFFFFLQVLGSLIMNNMNESDYMFAAVLTVPILSFYRSSNTIMPSMRSPTSPRTSQTTEPSATSVGRRGTIALWPSKLHSRSVCVSGKNLNQNKSEPRALPAYILIFLAEYKCSTNLTAE